MKGLVLTLPENLKLLAWGLGFSLTPQYRSYYEYLSVQM